ncbi:MAG: GNAT family N-acetyltransferase [Oscillospiraceae bacterium]|nr:GNAT family N-acetyltransferase [Oscillospiraceae bacterium]
MRKIDRAEIDNFRETALKHRASANFFGDSEKLHAFADQGDLYIAESEAGIFVLWDAGGFFRLYYALFDTDAPMPQKLLENALPIVAETAYRGEFFPPSADFFARHGFLRALTRSRMELRELTAKQDAAATLPEADPEAVLDLFKASFDRYTGCIPALPELKKASGEGRVITAAQNGGLCGALLYEEAGNISSLKNIAVAQNMRGRGFGGAMLDLWARRSALAGKSVLRLWVSDENAAAVKLYQKHNFKPDGLKSFVFVKK